MCSFRKVAADQGTSNLVEIGNRLERPGQVSRWRGVPKLGELDCAINGRRSNVGSRFEQCRRMLEQLAYCAVRVWKISLLDADMDCSV